MSAAASSTHPAPVSAVLFDLYGTLIDIRTDEEDPGVYAALSQYLAYLNVWISPEDLRREYRSRVRASLDRSPGGHPEVDVHQIFLDMVTAHRRAGPAPVDGGGPDAAPDLSCLALATAGLFRTLTRRTFGVFPEVHQTLERLQVRYRLGIVSDAQWVFTDPELEMADLARFFPVIILSSRVGRKKPDPRIFAEAVGRLGVRAAETVYVGDSPERDLVGARNAGIRCILFRTEDACYDGLQADACFRSYTDLAVLLDRIAQ
ncbi:MAG TPA: HAD family hydrolase [bacterium]|nr:HAD family hydrolase [bacterium]